MGQAKQRGTKQERIAQSVEAKAVREAMRQDLIKTRELEMDYLLNKAKHAPDKLTPDERRNADREISARRGKSRGAVMLASIAAMGIMR